MKFRSLILSILSASLVLFAGGTEAQPVTNTNLIGPRLTFLTNSYDFGKVYMGTAVLHTFIVSNSGDQPLEITAVTPGCHCTTAGQWTSPIAPGMTGKIPLKFDSSGIHGSVTRNISVASNDKHAPLQGLSISGTVWQAVEVSPQYAYMSIMPDAVSNTTAIVHIRNQSDKPMTVSDPVSVNNSFKATLKTVTEGKDYELTISPVPPLRPGSTGGTITLHTSLTNMPSLNVSVMAMLQPPIGVVPNQIVLPPEMLFPMTNTLTYAANIKRPLKISDAVACCDTNITLTLKELSPGRVFQLVAVFPAGYKVAPTQDAQVTVKTSFPDQPTIIVPVRQYPRQPMQSAPAVIHARGPGVPTLTH